MLNTSAGSFISPQRLQFRTPGKTENLVRNLRLSEIMYHPASRTDGRDVEFVEIYNSQPWAEDLTGYRISGDVSYNFPAGTIIPALGRLVIAAVPADVEVACWMLVTRSLA